MSRSLKCPAPHQAGLELFAGSGDSARRMSATAIAWNGLRRAIPTWRADGKVNGNGASARGAGTFYHMNSIRSWDVADDGRVYFHVEA